MKKIFALFLSVGLFLMALPSQAAESYSPFSLSLCATGHGAFTNNDTIPLSAGVGGSAFLDWRPLGLVSFGVGFSYLDFSGDNPWQVASLDLGGRLFPFGSGDGGLYFQGGVGVNLISHNLAANDSYPGNYHATAGLGFRALLGPGLALDLGPQYDFYTPLLQMPNINAFGFKLGLALLMGKSSTEVAAVPAQSTPASSLQDEKQALGVPISKQEMGAPASKPEASIEPASPEPIEPAISAETKALRKPGQKKIEVSAAERQELAAPAAEQREPVGPVTSGQTGEEKAEAPAAQTAPQEGNIEVLEKTQPETAEEAPVTQYSVLKGDCLWVIAGKGSIYNDSFQWPLIFQANRDRISDPDLIYPEQDFSIRRDFTQEETDKARQKAGDTPKYVPHTRPRESLPVDYF